MNVIISKDKSVRFTQESSSACDIQNITFYIAKELEVKNILFSLKKMRSIYSFELSQIEEVQNYNVYKIEFTQPVKLSSRTYELILYLNGEEIFLKEKLLAEINIASPVLFRNLSIDSDKPYGLTDSHEPIEIIDKKIIITNNQNVLVAEDNISQCLTFRLNRFYDGIDLKTKDLYFDYVTEIIDPETGITKEDVFSIRLNHFENSEDGYVQEEGTDYLLISFAVPYEIVSKAGEIAFDLSATEQSLTHDAITGNARQYVWQTLPSVLTIEPNLFKRKAIPQSSTQQTGNEELLRVIDALEQTTQELAQADIAIKQRISSIEGSDIYNLDTDANDDEVIVGGGGVDSIMEV